MEKQYYISKEQFAALTAAWTSTKSHTAAEHIIYNILRSKPAKLGFVERSKNIQGNDSWYAYHEALKAAQSFCSLKNPWAHRNPAEPIYQRAEERIKANQEQFKLKFGFEMPADFADQLGAA